MAKTKPRSLNAGQVVSLVWEETVRLKNRIFTEIVAGPQDQSQDPVKTAWDRAGVLDSLTVDTESETSVLVQVPDHEVGLANHHLAREILDRVADGPGLVDPVVRRVSPVRYELSWSPETKR